MNFDYLPPMIPHTRTVNQQVLLIEQWNSDALLKTHLKCIPEPSPADTPDDLEFIRTYIKLKRMRIRRLEQMCSLIAPRRSFEIESELAAEQFGRKVLAYRIFPIRDFPNEILTEIFRYVLWSIPTRGDETITKLRLTWTCRRFREIALADRLLWNEVHFTDSPPWARSLAFINRAHSAPLSIYIQGKQPRTFGQDVKQYTCQATASQITWLLDIVLQKISTIRELVIEVADMLPGLAVLDSLHSHGPAESLQRLVLRRHGPPDVVDFPTDSSSPHLFRQAKLCDGKTPKLTSIYMEGLAMAWDYIEVMGLRSIEMARIDEHLRPDDCAFRTMLSAPLLRRLYLCAAGPEWPIDGQFHTTKTYEPEKMGNLRELFLGDMEVDYALLCLDYIDAPNVVDLSLCGLNDDDCSPVLEAMTTYFRQVGVLTLYSIKLPATLQTLGSLVRFLESMPCLKLLKLADVPPLLFRALLEDPRPFRLPESDSDPARASTANEEQERPVVCPSLQALFFTAVSTREILQFVKLRRDLGYPLARIHVPAPLIEELPPDDLQQIRSIVPVVAETSWDHLESNYLGPELPPDVPNWIAEAEYQGDDWPLGMV